MDPTLDSVSFPFTIPDLYHGFAEGVGILHLEENALALEYQVQDAFLGILKSRIRELRIPYAELRSIAMRKGWFRRTLVLRTATLRSVASVPGSAGGELILRVKRVDRTTAREAVARLTLRMSEIRLERIENW